MARFVDPLVVGRVIGEVVDLFVPSISMTVAYDGPKDISNGCLLKPSATAAPPLVRISGRRNDLYTPVGIHRYVLVLFERSRRRTSSASPLPSSTSTRRRSPPAAAAS
ncbi:Protein MOTHER of FT and TFL1 [Zea mays]|uniref:Protein MOTHER of FT and TFL1 n=1 Tax=Zea mays TaxID=4577 RepID=A0A1D6FD01_MAIZE|nr:Protein MOTHER of FT and TFL1 [Zea mays]